MTRNIEDVVASFRELLEEVEDDYRGVDSPVVARGRAALAKLEAIAHRIAPTQPVELSLDAYTALLEPPPAPEVVDETAQITDDQWRELRQWHGMRWPEQPPANASIPTEINDGPFFSPPPAKPWSRDCAVPIADLKAISRWHQANAKQPPPAYHCLRCGSQVHGIAPYTPAPCPNCGTPTGRNSSIVVPSTPGPERDEALHLAHRTAQNYTPDCQR